MQLQMPSAELHWLDVETVKSILDGVTVGLTGRADAHNPVVAETQK